jgi:hypothetical protein
MAYTTEEEMKEIEYIGKVFPEDQLDLSLQRAQEFATEGYVASLPQLIRKRIDLNHRGFCIEELRTRGYSAFSEENIGQTPQGNSILVLVHGGGILSTPERIKNCTLERIREYEKLHPRFAYTEKEFQDLLKGKIQDEEIPMIQFDDFIESSDLPIRYGIIMDLDSVMNRVNSKLLCTKKRNGASSYSHPAQTYFDDPLFIARVGGIRNAHELIASHINRDPYIFRDIENRVFEYQRVDSREPQGTFLRLGQRGAGMYPDEGDIGYHMLYPNEVGTSTRGRFTGVSRRALDSLEQLYREDAKNKLVERVLEESKSFVPKIAQQNFEDTLRKY